MKFFLDTANLDEIREAVSFGIADGVTTNPTLISKEGNVDFEEHIAAICAGPAAVGAVCVRSEGVRFEITNKTVLTVRPDSLIPGNITKERNQRFIERKKAYAT